MLQHAFESISDIISQLKWEYTPKIKTVEKLRKMIFHSKSILSHPKDITAASKHYSNNTFEYLSKEYAMQSQSSYN